MLVETRRRALLDLINRQGFATLEELVRATGASESTVRRDLEALDQAGAVKRTHGGAVCSGEVRAMPALDDRATAAAEEKRAIGRAAAGLVEDGETVLLDGGTTTLEVARALVGRPLQVVTNSLPIAHPAGESSKDTDLILIGGYVYPRTGVAMGPLAVATMQGIRVRHAILGAGGIIAEGVFNSNFLLVETERQMMACGQEVIVAADHSKFGRLSLSRLCGLDEVHRVVTDAGLAPADPRAARAGRRRPVDRPARRPTTAATAADGDGRDPIEDRSQMSAPLRAAATSSASSARSSRTAMPGAVDERPRPAHRPNLVVNISARHCHLTQEHVDILFGPGYQLTELKRLYQATDFAANETVAVVGPRQRMIPSVRILGPCRKFSQVELAFTDAISLGIDAPGPALGRHRGDARLPARRPEGHARAADRASSAPSGTSTWATATPSTTASRQLDRMNLRVEGPCPTTLEGLLVRTHPDWKLEVHIDTDEGERLRPAHATKVELVKP